MDNLNSRAIQTALAHHKAGRLQQAEAIYRQVLQTDPRHPDALHLLGLIALHSRNYAIASQLIGRAIDAGPSSQMHYNLGIALQAEGKILQAIENYRQAVLLQPDFAEAHDNLGTALQDEGRLEDAVASHRRAISLKPGLAGAHFNIGNALQKLARPGEAIESYRQAIFLNPNFADAHGNMGNALRAQGRLNEALASYRKALSLKPDSAELHCNLGNVLRDQRRLDEAIIHYRRALSLKPDMAEAHCNLGLVLEAQDHKEEAIASCTSALALKPGLPEAHVALASIHLDHGEFEAARDALSRALESSPDCANAWAMLTKLRKMTPQDDWIESALRLLSKPALQRTDRIEMLYAVGKYYDDTGQFDLAFPAYREANVLQRRMQGGFDRTKCSGSVDATMAAYPAALLARRHAEASASERPVLVVGMPRSGTSLVEQIIASHPQAFGAGELGFWTRQAAQVHPPAIEHGNAMFIADAAAAYEQLLQRYSTEAIRVVDKKPENFFHLGLVHTVFPQASIIHLKRNPVDTCLSIHFHSFAPSHAYATDLDDLAFFYLEYSRLMQHWRESLPAGRILEVPYEELIEDQAEWSRRIIEFIGLQWDERCLEFYKTARKVGTPSNWQARQRIYRDSKERWRNYEAYVEPLLGLLTSDRAK
jgi:tetratricopeptide (TPR) repeat protein